MSLALLFVALFKTRSQTSLLMVQNPPGIPTLIICLFVRWLKRANFVIDWHNYTWSVMQYRSSPMNDYSRQKSVSGISYKSLFELLCLCLLFDLKIAKIIYIFEREECSFIVISVYLMFEKYL